jgi:hypothetical protein
MPAYRQRPHLRGIFPQRATGHSTQMVNVGFPAPSFYGFEMVDARRVSDFPERPPSIENLHRIKSIAFSSNFRRFNLNANTCDLSTAVNQVLIAKSKQD